MKQYTTNADIAAYIQGILLDSEQMTAHTTADNRFRVTIGTLTLRCDADKVQGLINKLTCPEHAARTERIQFSMERAYTELKTLGPWDWQKLPRPNAGFCKRLEKD